MTCSARMVESEETFLEYNLNEYENAKHCIVAEEYVKDG